MVEPDAERLEILSDSVKDPVAGDAPEKRERLLFGDGKVPIACFVANLLGEIEQVTPPIPVFRQFGLPPARLQVACVQGFSEPVDLVPHIVHVILGRHPAAGECQNSRKGISHGCSPAVSHVERAGGIRRNELEENPVPVRFLGSPEPFPLFQGGRKDLPPRVIGQHDIDESRPGHGKIPEAAFPVFPPDGGEELRSHIPGFFLQVRCQLHRRIRGKIAVPLLPRNLHRNGDFPRNPPLFQFLFYSCQDEGFGDLADVQQTPRKSENDFEGNTL